MNMDADFLAKYVARITRKDKKIPGSGVAISDSLLLTAAHVVKGFEYSDITVEFPGAPELQNLDNDSRSVNIEKIIFFKDFKNDDDENIDIALIVLKSSPLKTSLTGGELSFKCFDEKDVWLGLGYPKLHDENVNYDQVIVGGEACAGVINKSVFDIRHKEETTNSKVKDWQGLSGSPVVAKEGKRLVGIVSSVPESLPKRIEVVSIPHILKCHQSFLAEYDKAFPKNAEVRESFRAAESQIEQEIVEDLEVIFSNEVFGRQLVRIIKSKPSTPELKKLLRSCSKPKDLSLWLVEKCSEVWLLRSLEEAMREIKLPLKDDNSKYDFLELVDTLEILASRLIAKAVSFEVMQNYSLHIGKYFNQGAVIKIPVVMSVYAEAVVSRWLCKEARLSSGGDIYPIAHRSKDTLVLFEAMHNGAAEESLAKGLYRCFTGLDPSLLSGSRNKIELMYQAISLSVKINTEDENEKLDHKKMMYFLESDPGRVEIIKKTESLIELMEEELDGRLKIFDLSDASPDPVTEKERKLLVIINKIFNLRKNLIDLGSHA